MKRVRWNSAKAAAVVVAAVDTVAVAAAVVVAVETVAIVVAVVVAAETVAIAAAGTKPIRFYKKRLKQLGRFFLYCSGGL
jgi:hypothetical protein